MRIRPVLLTALMVLATVLVATVVLDRAASPATPSCKDADQRADAGMVADAQKAYMSILHDDPGSPCGKAGIRAVAAERCARAQALATAGAPADARRRYLAILHAELPGAVLGVPEPWSAQCALDGLEELGPAKPGAAS